MADYFVDTDLGTSMVLLWMMQFIDADGLFTMAQA